MSKIKLPALLLVATSFLSVSAASASSAPEEGVPKSAAVPKSADAPAAVPKSAREKMEELPRGVQEMVWHYYLEGGRDPIQLEHGLNVAELIKTANQPGQRTRKMIDGIKDVIAHEDVYIDSKNITSKNIDILATADHLTVLHNRYDSPPLREVLEQVKHLPKLKVLVIDERHEGQDLNGLKQLGGLKQLILRMRDLTTLEPLRGLTNLDRLYVLDMKKIRDLSPLVDLQNLSLLRIDSLKGVTDLTPLAKLKNLKELQLADFGEKMPDLRPLYELKQLRKLVIVGNKITAEQKEELQAALPKTNIVELDWDRIG